MTAVDDVLRLRWALLLSCLGWEEGDVCIVVWVVLRHSAVTLLLLDLTSSSSMYIILTSHDSLGADSWFFGLNES